MTPIKRTLPDLLQQADEASQIILEQAEQTSAELERMTVDLNDQATDLSRGEPLQ